MDRVRTDWRWSRVVACAAVSVLVGGLPAYAANTPPAVIDGAVDPAAKLLLKADGLFNRGLFKDAAEDYASFLRQYPHHAGQTDARYALAGCQYQQQQYQPAIDLLQQVLRDDQFTRRDEALAVLGHCELQLKHYDAAVSAFDELLARFPRSKQAEIAALNKAQVLYLDKKYPDAVAAAEAFGKQYPQSDQRPAALYLLALAQRSLNQGDAAGATLRELVSHFPDNRIVPDALLLLGQTLEAQGKPDAAAEQYRRLIARGTTSRAAAGQYSLGTLLYKQGKYDDAAKSLAIAAGGVDLTYAKPARLQLGLAQLAGGKIAEARRTLAAVIKDDPSRVVDARYGLAQADMAEKKFGAARTTLESLMQLQPAPINIQQMAMDHAVCLLELKEYAQAAQEFAAVVQKQGPAAQMNEAMYRQAFCLYKLGKYEQSHAACARVGGASMAFVAATAALDAENLFLLGKYAEASNHYAALLEQAGSEDAKLPLRVRLGQCAYYQGDYSKAIELLTPLADHPKVAADPMLNRAIFLLGDALLQQKNDVAAAKILAAYLPLAKADKQEAQFKLGMAQLGLGQQEAAQENFRAVGAGAADSAWTSRANLALGQLAYQGKPQKVSEASDAIKRALDENPPDDVAATALYLLGWINFDAKQYTDAAQKWDQVISKYPRDPNAGNALYQRGVALREAGQNQPALDALQSYLKLYPTGQRVHAASHIAAGALSSLHRDVEAKAILTSLASDASAVSDSVLYDLAWSDKATKDDAGATAAYRRLLKDYPTSTLAPTARTELADLLYAGKQYDEAIELLQSAIKDPTNDPPTVATAQYLLGWCYERQGKGDQAAGAFEDYVKSAGSHAITGAEADRVASALLQSGLAHAQSGKLDAAAQSLEEMLRRFPQHKDAPIALLKLGEVQADANDFDAALRTNQEFLRKYPADPFAYRAYFGVGWASENLKKYADARDAYAKVIAASNSETAARAQFQTGETYLEEGKFEPAIPALLAVEDVYAYPKWSARALFEAGRAFEQLKQLDRARQQYAQVVTKYKTAPEAELAQDRLKTLK